MVWWSVLAGDKVMGVVSMFLWDAKVVGRLRYHSLLVAQEWVPVRVMVPGHSMVAVVASKWVVQQWSQSWPMEMREPEVRARNMWVVQTYSGRDGIGACWQ